MKVVVKQPKQRAKRLHEVLKRCRGGKMKDRKRESKLRYDRRLDGE